VGFRPHYTKVMALRTVWLFLVLAASGLAQSAPVTLAVHVLAPCPAHGSGQPIKLPGVDSSLCLDGAPFLTEKDVQSAEIHKNSQGRPLVFLTFHEVAAVREMEITRKNIGNRVGIVLNGRTVAAPSIPGASRFLYIDGNYTEKQALDLVTAFNKLAGNR